MTCRGQWLANALKYHEAGTESGSARVTIEVNCH